MWDIYFGHLNDPIYSFLINHNITILLAVASKKKFRYKFQCVVSLHWKLQNIAKRNFLKIYVSIGIYHILWNGRHIIKVIILCIFSAVPTGLFIEINKLNLKFVWKRNSQNYLEKEGLLHYLILRHFKAVVIKNAVLYGNRQTDRWNRIETRNRCTDVKSVDFQQRCQWNLVK